MTTTFRIQENSNREIARINPDGTWWIVPDITINEIQTIFHTLLETAAKQLQEINRLKEITESKTGCPRCGATISCPSCMLGIGT